MPTLLVPVLCLLLAVPAAAQEWQVARERFAFVGHRLTVNVDSDAPGTLRIIRGGPGSVRVASRAVTGFTAAALADQDELTLTTAGSGPVDYLVSVPEETWVNVRLPGSRFGESVRGRQSSRTFSWEARRGPGRAEPAPDWLPTDDGPLFTTLARDLAPAIVSLPDLTNIRSVSIRVEPGPFRASASRPLSLHEGDDQRLVIRPAAPPMDLVLLIPTGTHSFRLDAGGRTALTVTDGEITTLCSPVTQQWLSDGRRWLTFNPVAGSLRCTAHSTLRHEG